MRRQKRHHVMINRHLAKHRHGDTLEPRVEPPPRTPPRHPTPRSNAAGTVGAMTSSPTSEPQLDPTAAAAPLPASPGEDTRRHHRRARRSPRRQCAYVILFCPFTWNPLSHARAALFFTPCARGRERKWVLSTHALRVCAPLWSSSDGSRTARVPSVDDFASGLAGGHPRVRYANYAICARAQARSRRAAG